MTLEDPLVFDFIHDFQNFLMSGNASQNAHREEQDSYVYIQALDHLCKLAASEGVGQAGHEGAMGQGDGAVDVHEGVMDDVGQGDVAVDDVGQGDGAVDVHDVGQGDVAVDDVGQDDGAVDVHEGVMDDVGQGDVAVDDVGQDDGAVNKDQVEQDQVNDEAVSDEAGNGLVVGAEMPDHHVDQGDHQDDGEVNKADHEVHDHVDVDQADQHGADEDYEDKAVDQADQHGADYGYEYEDRADECEEDSANDDDEDKDRADECEEDSADDGEDSSDDEYSKDSDDDGEDDLVEETLASLCKQNGAKRGPLDNRHLPTTAIYLKSNSFAKTLRPMNLKALKSFDSGEMWTLIVPPNWDRVPTKRRDNVMKNFNMGRMYAVLHRNHKALFAMAAGDVIQKSLRKLCKERGSKLMTVRQWMDFVKESVVVRETKRLTTDMTGKKRKWKGTGSCGKSAKGAPHSFDFNNMSDEETEEEYVR